MHFRGPTPKGMYAYGCRAFASAEPSRKRSGRNSCRRQESLNKLLYLTFVWKIYMREKDFCFELIANGKLGVSSREQHEGRMGVPGVRRAL